MNDLHHVLRKKTNMRVINIEKIRRRIHFYCRRRNHAKTPRGSLSFPISLCTPILVLKKLDFVPVSVFDFQCISFFFLSVCSFTFPQAHVLRVLPLVINTPRIVLGESMFQLYLKRERHCTQSTIRGAWLARNSAC